MWTVALSSRLLAYRYVGLRGSADPGTLGSRVSPEEGFPSMPSKDPVERNLLATLAVHKKWAGIDDRSAATAPARRGLAERFEREADPDGVLAPEERTRRAEHLRKAHFAELALKSVRARRARDRAAELEAEVAAALSDVDEGAA